MSSQTGITAASALTGGGWAHLGAETLEPKATDGMLQGLRYAETQAQQNLSRNLRHGTNNLFAMLCRQSCVQKRLLRDVEFQSSRSLGSPVPVQQSARSTRQLLWRPSATPNLDRYSSDTCATVYQFGLTKVRCPLL